MGSKERRENQIPRRETWSVPWGEVPAAARPGAIRRKNREINPKMDDGGN